jgi:hypothetical protein
MTRIIIVIIVILAFNAQAQLRFTKEVDTIAQLKTLNTLDVNKSCNVKGYLVPNDGGGGLFNADPNSAEATDAGIVILPNSGVGRWRRVVQGRDYHALWWGGVKTNSVLQAAIDWVSANGWGKVICDGGSWILKCDDSTRIQIKTGVTLTTAEDSQLECAPNPADNWILIDFPLDVHDCQIGPARLLGWNLNPPGGDPNKTGLIFSIQDTRNVTIGGVRASNWYSRYADVGSGNYNLQLLDENWERTIKGLGAQVDGLTDDTKSVQDAVYYAERYVGEVVYPTGTNICLQTTVWVTNGIPIRIRGHDSKVDVFYSQPGDVTNSRLSAAFIIGSHGVTVDGLNFRNVSTNYNPITEESTTTGYYIPINIYLATNVVIRNCTFDVPTGKGIVSSGSYGVFENNRFLNGCGITFGVGQPHNWLYFQNTVPLGADQIYLSPIGCRVTDNYFTGSNAFKNIVFFSAANRFTFARNKMIDISTPINPVLVYTGDLGTTDSRGTNVTIYEGTINDNTIQGSFGGAAIRCTFITPTNYVPATFDPDTMVSAITINNNHVDGIGRGIELVDAKGTKINGGDYRVTQEMLALYGDTDGEEVSGSYFETTGASTTGSCIVFGNSFLAPVNFRNVRFHKSKFVVGPQNEFWFRTIGATVDSFTVDTCDVVFLGASGAGDAPGMLQLTQTTNYVSLLNNYFYSSNNMTGRRLIALTGTNCDFNLLRNTFIPLSSTAAPRGPVINGRTVTVIGNDLRNIEIADARDLFVSDNYMMYGDVYPPLDVQNADLSVISNNRIYHTNSVSALAAQVSSTNSTFANNIVRGNSGSDIVMSLKGKMYVHNNVIRNIGAGFIYPTAAGTGSISDDIYEHPLNVNQGTYAGDGLNLQRSGSINKFALLMDDGDAQYHVRTNTASYLGGHNFWVRKADGTEVPVLRLVPGTPPGVYFGDETNAALMKISAFTNGLIYVDDNGIVSKVIMGGNMTFVAGTLNSTGGGGGGSTNDTPWAIDHDANQLSLTNLGGLRMSHASGTGISMLMTNTEGSYTMGADGGGASFDISDNTATFEYRLNTTPLVNFSLAGIRPRTGSQTVGISTDPFLSAFLKSTGVNIGGINIRSGSGSPEGVQTDPVGSIWIRTNGTAGLIFYVKETGVSNTGWVAMKSGATGTVPTMIAIACSDLTTPLVAGTFKGYIRAPYAFTVTGVRASLSSAQTSGTILTCDINESGVSILSTKLTIDNAEKTSTTAATPAVISDTSIADDAEISVDIDSVGTSPAGLIIEISGLR